MRASDAQEGAVSRADALRAPLAALALGGVASQALADDEAAPAPAAPPVVVEKVTEEPKVYEFPKDWGIQGDYYTDAAKVVRHMRIATSMDKNYPNMETIGTNMKKEMIDFISFYRRFTNVAGRQSFSTLYTAINVLAGHYTSYGVKFPVPEKRRKRLFQEYNEIEKNIKKKR